jgi:hypothetical protein
MNYNIYYKGHFVTNNILDLPETKLNKILAAYKNGESSFTLTGKEYSFNNVSEIRIFMNEANKSASELEISFDNNNLYTRGFGGEYVEPCYLSKFGAEVTEDMIGDNAYGYGQQKTVREVKSRDSYIDTNRIDELRAICSNEYDLSKLIRLCEELNSNWNDGNFFTVGLLIRTIINHVPPIFGLYTSFDQVVSNYGGGKSFKKNMEHLNESLRSIADSYTHLPIRKKEPLPNEQQVDYRSNLDFLLTEIITLLHK